MIKHLSEHQIDTLPGHWLLARLGKRVLRPGGVELTKQLIDALNIEPLDRVVEFAPGLGATAQRVLARHPASYTAVEQDPEAAYAVRKISTGANQRCVNATAEETGLESGAFDVVLAEAMMSMQRPQQKIRMITEAARLLRTGGLYGMHELCLVPDDLSEDTQLEIERAVAGAIHHNVKPLRESQWIELLAELGLSVTRRAIAPMHLLEPRRLIDDEGVVGSVRFAWNLLRERESRKRVVAMRGVFKKYRPHLSAIMIVAVKTEPVL